TLPLSFSRRVFASMSLKTFSYLALLVTAIAVLAYFWYTRILRKNVGPLETHEKEQLNQASQESNLAIQALEQKINTQEKIPETSDAEVVSEAFQTAVPIQHEASYTQTAAPQEPETQNSFVPSTVP